jgi:hypothetical protein
VVYVAEVSGGDVMEREARRRSGGHGGGRRETRQLNWRAHWGGGREGCNDIAAHRTGTRGRRGCKGVAAYRTGEGDPPIELAGTLGRGTEGLQ